MLVFMSNLQLYFLFFHSLAGKGCCELKLVSVIRHRQAKCQPVASIFLMSFAELRETYTQR